MRILSPTDEGWRHPPSLPDSELTGWLRDIRNAMVRATEKELDRKRKLGYQIVVWRDGRVQVVDP